MASELVGQEAVGATQSWCLAGNYVATFMVAQFFPLVNSWMNDRWGGRGWAYFGFAGLAALSFAFVVVSYDTRGRREVDVGWRKDELRY